MCQVDCEVANRPLFKVTPKHSCEVPSIVEVVQVATWELQTAGLSLELHAPDAHPPTGCFLDGVYLDSLVTKITERDNLVILGELKHSVISDDLDNYVIFENFVTRLEFSSQFSSHFQNSHPFSKFPQFGL